MVITNNLAMYGSQGDRARFLEALMAEPELGPEAGVRVHQDLAMLWVIWETIAATTRIDFAGYSDRFQLLLRHWNSDSDSEPRCWVDGDEVEDT